MNWIAHARTALIVAALTWVGSTPSAAAILGTYTFTGLTDLPAPASSVDPLVAVSSLTEGAGSAFDVVNNNGSDRLHFVYSASSSTDEAAAVAANQYIEFTVTPLGSIVDFSTITWNGYADTTTTARSFTFFVRSSADSYATTLDSDTRTSVAFAGMYTADLDISSLTNITAPHTFRMYYHDNSNSGGHVYIDNLTINGVAALVPEPASLALVALGGLLCVRRRTSSR
jgi:hypothetical protein